MLFQQRKTYKLKLIAIEILLKNKNNRMKMNMSNKSHLKKINKSKICKKEKDKIMTMQSIKERFKPKDMLLLIHQIKIPI